MKRASIGNLAKAGPTQSPWAKVRRPRILASVVLYTVAMAGWLAVEHHRGTSTIAYALIDWIPLAVQILECGLLLGLVRHLASRPGTHRTAWFCFAGGCGMALIAMLWGNLAPAGFDTPRGGIADFLYGLSYVAYFLGWTNLYRDFGGTLRSASRLLELGMLVIAALALEWVFLVAPRLPGHAASTGDLLALLVFAGGAASVFVAMALVAMQRSSWTDSPRITVFMLAGAIEIVNDIGWLAVGMPDDGYASAPSQFTFVIVQIVAIWALLLPEERDASYLARTPPKAGEFVPPIVLLCAVGAIAGVHPSTAAGAPPLVTMIAGTGVVLLGASVWVKWRERVGSASETAPPVEVTLASLLECSRYVVAVSGTDGLLSYLSPGGSELLGLPAESVSATHVSALFGEANSERLRSYLGGLETGIPFRDIDFLLHGKDGSVRVVAVSGDRHMAQGGESGIALAIRDVTDERHAERALADRARRQREEWSSDVHEGLAQDLAGIALMLKSVQLEPRASRESGADLIAGVVAETTKAIARVRDLACSLSPLHVVRGSLPLALEHLARQFERTHGIRVEIRIAGGDWGTAGPHLDDIYLVIQDGLGCVAESTRCARIAVTLARRSSVLEVIVRGDRADTDPVPYQPDVDTMRRLDHRVRRMRGALCTAPGPLDSPQVVAFLPAPDGELSDSHAALG